MAAEQAFMALVTRHDKNDIQLPDLVSESNLTNYERIIDIFRRCHVRKLRFNFAFLCDNCRQIKR